MNAAMRLMLEQPQLDPEGTWVIRLRTGEHVLSPRSRELLGIGDDEPISIQRLLAALHPADRERWKGAVGEVLDSESSGACSIEFRTAGSNPRWLAASGRAFFEGMRAVRVAGTLREITECTLGEICREAIAETSAAHPGRAIDLECWDKAPGAWDRGRMSELVRALLDEAIDRSTAREPVMVAVIDCNREVLLAVASFGAAPMAERENAAVREMVRALRGRVERISDESGAVFHVWLPKGGRS